MSLIPYALTRPFLFGMDAEAAHELTMDMLARGQRTPLQWAWCNEAVDDPIQLAGLTFPNRVGLAAGLEGTASTVVRDHFQRQLRACVPERASIHGGAGQPSAAEAALVVQGLAATGDDAERSARYRRLASARSRLRRLAVRRPRGEQ